MDHSRLMQLARGRMDALDAAVQRTEQRIGTEPNDYTKRIMATVLQQAQTQRAMIAGLLMRADTSEAVDMEMVEALS